MLRASLRATAVVLLSVGVIHAQITTATIPGTVTDASGAVLPGAKVVIQNEETGISRSVAADSAGRYSAPSPSLGKYRVTVSQDGFETEVRSGIELTVGGVSRAGTDAGIETQTRGVDHCDHPWR
jgi:hypothetical protein